MQPPVAALQIRPLSRMRQGMEVGVDGKTSALSVLPPPHTDDCTFIHRVTLSR